MSPDIPRRRLPSWVVLAGDYGPWAVVTAACLTFAVLCAIHGNAAGMWIWDDLTMLSGSWAWLRKAHAYKHTGVRQMLAGRAAVLEAAARFPAGHGDLTVPGTPARLVYTRNSRGLVITRYSMDDWEHVCLYATRVPYTLYHLRPATGHVLQLAWADTLIQDDEGTYFAPLGAPLGPRPPDKRQLRRGFYYTSARELHRLAAALRVARPVSTENSDV